MNKIEIGQSVQQRLIEAWLPESRKVTTLVIGGVHGDEVEGVVAAQALLQTIFENTAIIPILNIDGYESGSRLNSNGIDLNRNLGTKDWTSEAANDRYVPGPSPNSEPENQALVSFIDEYKPKLIISLHSFKHPMLNINGDCVEFADKLAKAVGYETKEDIGYPTPGCLGTYYGLEGDIPVVTYEFLRGMPSSEIKEVHVPAIAKSLIEFKV